MTDPIDPAAAGPAADPLDAVSGVLAVGGTATVVGAPGTGKTTLLEELFCRLDARSTLVLCPSRDEADQLRDRLARRVPGLRPGALARTPQSLAFGLVSAAVRLAGEEDVRYLSGADQDAYLADILAGHERGEGRMPQWPAELNAQVRATAAFRVELRDVISRVTEHGISTAELRAAAARGRRAWAACAEVLAEYEAVTALDQAPRYDSAALLVEAAGVIAEETLPPATWTPPSVVLVDNAQDLTEGAARLLDALAARGAKIVLFGCPEAITQGFRGVTGHVLRDACRTAAPRFAAGRPHRVITLEAVYRHGAALASFSSDWARRISVFGAHGRPHWAAVPAARARDRGSIGVARAESPSEEAVLIARRLRERYRALIESGTQRPWSTMAIVCRSAAVLPPIRRELLSQGIPLGDRLPDRPLRDHPATRPLLEVMHWPEHEPDAEQIEDVLLSPYGGLDTMSLRRLRRKLLLLDEVRARTEAAPGGDPYSPAARAAADGKVDGAPRDPRERIGEVMRRAVLDPGDSLTAAHPALQRVAAMARAARTHQDKDVLEALWAVWEASGRAEPWRRQALGRDGASVEDQDAAHERLDSVMRLFALAEKLWERDPGLGVEAFVARVAQQEIAQDSLAKAGTHEDAVTLTTVAAVGNREWDHVVVPHVQEGQWPNLTVRGSLLGAEELVEAVRGGQPAPAPSGGSAAQAGLLAERLAAARRRVFRDEAGMFLAAVSRGRESVLVTAVESEEEAPSPFLTVLAERVPAPATGEAARRDTAAGAGSPGAPRPEAGAEDPAQDAGEPGADEPETDETARQYPLTLRGLVGRLRSELGESHLHGRPAGAAAPVLAALAEAGVPGAAPSDWAGTAERTRAERLADEAVPVSPSAIDLFESCPLRWFLERHGGTAPADGPAQEIGTMAHAIAEAHPNAPEDELRRAFEQGLERLEFPTEWERALARERGAAMMANLARYQHARADRLAGSEVPVDVTLRAEGELIRIRGVIDRLDLTPEGYRIIDYKTGRQALSKDRAAGSGQLLAYQVALGSGRLSEEEGGLRVTGDPADDDAGLPVAGAELVYLAAGPTSALATREQEPLRDEESRVRAHERLAAVARGMRGPHYPATPSSDCRTCPVRAACPAMSTQG
ncbi:UrvD/REP family ATP-dependent DNA helicase [Sediminivirga luteola]|uniref:DNA 3'-5' helicase n=1 Tax=Sediminivirga luteola TaxID=1774748 RepID=A0A8J2TWC5_9MICO|nr:UrvD/REP family ATP-dependent DNA helicase [Sediminivirga luteola]MCI2265683.1 PD-(D/E)XK nuclease family protein [Sediminivirga luteola]GGA07438.1 DNA helicase [Sediminivirga luteola]